MENIKKPNISSIRRQWKTILALTLVAGASFTAGTYANRVFVGLVQSIAGTHVLVPPPELSIFASTWSIDPQKSVVTDVGLLVTTNSQVWQLKIYQIHVQVSCLDETVTPPVEFICSTGGATVVLPTHGIGLRPIRILLDKPIDPETTEIHDLSFIVTDLGRVPPMPPTIFVGPTDVSIQVVQGSSVRVPIHVVGVAGVQAGTKVTVTSLNLPNGVTETDPAPLTLQADPKNPGVVMADSFFDIFADASAMVGSSDMTLMAAGTGSSGPLSDTATVDVNVFGGLFPNLLFSGCALPPTNNAGPPCFTVSGGTVVSLTVLNNGAASSAATTISVGSVIGQSTPTCNSLNAICTVPALSPGGSSVVKVVCPDTTTNCGFVLTVDPNNIVPESNEKDNTINGVIVNAPP